MPDESLLAVAANTTEEYTPDAVALANEEIVRRGGIEFLNRRVAQHHVIPEVGGSQEVRPPEIPDQSDDVFSRLKRFYWVFVCVAYGLFVYVIRGSLWLYWLLVFAMIAFWIGVWIRSRRLTPEEEYAEIAKDLANHPEKDNKQVNFEDPGA